MSDRKIDVRLQNFLLKLNKWLNEKIKPYNNINFDETAINPEEYEKQIEIYSQFKKDLGFFLRRKNELVRILSQILEEKIIDKDLKLKIQLNISQLNDLEEIDKNLTSIIQVIQIKNQNFLSNKDIIQQTIEEQELKENIDLKLDKNIPKTRGLSFFRRTVMFTMLAAAFFTNILDKALQSTETAIPMKQIIESEFSSHPDEDYIKKMTKLGYVNNVIGGELLFTIFFQNGYNPENIKTLEKKAKELLNMEKFYRLKAKDLQKVIENAQSKKQEDIAVIFLPRYESIMQTLLESAFTSKGCSLFLEKIIQIMPNTLVYEIENEEQMYNYIEQVGNAKGKISFMIIGGHGSKESLKFLDVFEYAENKTKDIESFEEQSNKKSELLRQLSKQKEKHYLDISDKEDIIKRDLKKYLKESAMIFLLACSTGEGENNLAQIIHNVFQRTVIASKTLLKIVEITIIYNQYHQIKQITLTDCKTRKDKTIELRK